MNIKEALQKTIQQLKQANIATYHIDALLILKDTIKKDDVYVLTNPQKELNDRQIEEIERLTNKRKLRYPMAYITHSKEFYGLEFYVDDRVLIPRPETELIVDVTLKIASDIKNPKIVDIGTGSGCIAITLSKLLDTHITASDISKEALNVAKLNAKRLDADISLINANGLDFLKNGIDIITTNPPYVLENEYELLSEDVKFEPKIALIPPSGNGFIEDLIEKAKQLTKWLIMEIGPSQLKIIKNSRYIYKIIRDFSNKERVAVFKF
ncbi:peptide chain release factor N(5)-glutamine methyltransferase [Hippea maritima]|uniref:peptide chain release factor N(5)-glutamine methyltransferase n=1 Tax=Hippea maritima (strain ATCC 700847 / DSM 10411 / MH2) TaxID=760142 RepID=F2LTR1_HIPMA|nr:peptide chain release factor N(5)-glutamine methyltransferase [Hippea maritima]AEA34437.1 protein-(glutamine-N5) methyltransferase, release factor-specific [Hippea maritima DSM 10411]